MNQGGRGRSSSGGGELVRLPVRWIVLFTGYKATEDYVPAASEGEDPALVKEATDICVAFHPHSEIRLFPKEALLFWKAKSTRDWVITRVSTAPNPDGIRTALEYSSVVLDEKSFYELRYNPFRTRDLELHEKVRAQFLAKTGNALWVDLPDESFGTTLAPETNGSRPSAPYGDSAGEIIPGLGVDRLASVDNVEKIEKYCAYCAVLQKVPPTFATWWPSGDPPAGYFDVVLHSAPARSMSLRDASDTVAALAAEITAALPRTASDDTVVSELARSVLANIDGAQRSLSDAVMRLNTETVDQFREHLSSASNSVAQVAANLRLIVKRLDDRISSTDAARLARLSQQSEAIGPEFLGIRHPNPFAQRTPAATSSTNTRLSSGRSSQGGRLKNNYGLIGGGIALLAIIGGGVALMMHNGSSDQGKPPVHVIHPNPTGKGSSAISTHGSAAQDSSLAKVVAAQNSVQDDAKSLAQDQATSAATADVTKAVPESEIETITVSSVKSAYRKFLDATTYRNVFGTGKHSISTYEDLKAQLPLLVPAVHEAAALAATQGQAQAALKSVATAAAVEKAKALADQRKADEAATVFAPSPAAHGSDNSGDRHPRETEHHAVTHEKAPTPTPAAHHVVKSESSPPPKKPAGSTSPSAPKSGSADTNGL